MWSLKVLTGPQAGQTFKLDDGQYTIGRADTCEVVLASKGVSKEHAKLAVRGQNLLLNDLGSSNGTFVNGRRVRSQALKAGDKVGFFDILIDVNIQLTTVRPHTAPPPQFDGNAAVWSQPQFAQQPSPAAYAPTAVPQVVADLSLQQRIVEGFETLVMPYLYEIAKKSDFRWMLGTIVMIYIALVTGLAVIPMNQLTSERIQKESQRRVATLAESLADKYKRAAENNMTASFSTQSIDREEGVELALVVSAQDGHILAPANKIGAYEKHVFVSRARRSDAKLVEQIDETTIGASHPISVYKAETDGYQAMAYAVVVYKTDSMSDDSGQVASLIFKVLCLALLLGIVLYVLFLRLIEKPLEHLTEQVDIAMREKRDTVENPFQHSALNQLVLNINALIGRANSGGGDASSGNLGEDISSELIAMSRMQSSPSMSLSTDRRILNLNQRFEDLIGMRLATVEAQGLEVLTDQALKLNIEDLIERATQQPGMIQSGQLEISGVNYELEALALSRSGSIAGYYLCLRPQEGGA
jgi:pSer/pThr/pTyr-binding forkhead associated (FHA) protein